MLKLQNLFAKITIFEKKKTIYKKLNTIIIQELVVEIHFGAQHLQMNQKYNLNAQKSIDILMLNRVQQEKPL